MAYFQFSSSSPNSWLRHTKAKKIKAICNRSNDCFLATAALINCSFLAASKSVMRKNFERHKTNFHSILANRASMSKNLSTLSRLYSSIEIWEHRVIFQRRNFVFLLLSCIQDEQIGIFSFRAKMLLFHSKCRKTSLKRIRVINYKSVENSTFQFDRVDWSDLRAHVTHIRARSFWGNVLDY